MLEKAIEIEGLLRIIRDGKPGPEVYKLLSNKAVGLAEDTMRLEESVSATDSNIKEQEMQDEDCLHEEETTTEQPAPADEELTDEDIQEDDDILLTLDEEEEDTGNPTTDKDNTDKDNIGEGNSPAETISANTAQRRIKLRSAFSLNDRFLYSRELFDGNMKMFDSTLDFLEGIEDYSIIEDYFYSELEWDPDNMHVAAFMETLRPRFKE